MRNLIFSILICFCSVSCSFAQVYIQDSQEFPPSSHDTCFTECFSEFICDTSILQVPVAVRDKVKAVKYKRKTIQIKNEISQWEFRGNPIIATRQQLVHLVELGVAKDTTFLMIKNHGAYKSESLTYAPIKQVHCRKNIGWCAVLCDDQLTEELISEISWKLHDTGYEISKWNKKVNPEFLSALEQYQLTMGFRSVGLSYKIINSMGLQQFIK